jgi:hypothetical protein
VKFAPFAALRPRASPCPPIGGHGFPPVQWLVGPAPALIALGTATMSHADTAVTTNGPSISAPVQHPAFPHQSNTPEPGTSVHHHHQNHE